MGQATIKQTLKQLGTDNAEELFLLMAQAHLPMPRLPETVKRTMAQGLHQLQTTKQAEKTKQLLLNIPASDIPQLRDPINAIRGSGAGGGTRRLLAQRRADAKRGK